MNTITIDELLERQEAALEAGDVIQARKLLEEIKAELDRRNAWRWLCDNAPESYGQLTDKLEQVGGLLARSGKIALRELREVFEWCSEHGIELAELQLPGHLSKYREAAAYLHRIRNSIEDDESKVQKMRETLARIQSDPNRRTTRAWVRNHRSQGG